MRILISVAVIISFAIILTEINGYKFGDILAFNHCSLYKHYAIYVGVEPRLNSSDNRTIFHRTGKTKAFSDCTFGVLKQNDHPDVENYLDAKFSSIVNAENHDEMMIANIKEWLRKCDKYKVRTNNCEHLATHVRYGFNVSFQPGTVASIFCGVRSTTCPDYKKWQDESERNAKLEESSDCNNNK